MVKFDNARLLGGSNMRSFKTCLTAKLASENKSMCPTFETRTFYVLLHDSSWYINIFPWYGWFWQEVQYFKLALEPCVYDQDLGPCLYACALMHPYNLCARMRVHAALVLFCWISQQFQIPSGFWVVWFKLERKFKLYTWGFLYLRYQIVRVVELLMLKHYFYLMLCKCSWKCCNIDGRETSLIRTDNVN